MNYEYLKKVLGAPLNLRRIDFESPKDSPKYSKASSVSRDRASTNLYVPLKFGKLSLSWFVKSFRRDVSSTQIDL